MNLVKSEASRFIILFAITLNKNSIALLIKRAFIIKLSLKYELTSISALTVQPMSAY